ncbi:methionyl-tRNA formyltransferase [[Clostridium] polysaccharolyticum]|uniref:Methionyl-tRNA formyltransferase n=1 Tax=[Clostridium] polysaccharolyticum TaxID=29364 RepID=A0A1H9Y0L7_9FIRM|nr:methionyl-tRNA formyltransferase [[Clostridium] polysaccharolyticum]SES62203.1 methionyl-tRNA formyltransferase [[Clostridium] polysaccharolyticum]
MKVVFMGTPDFSVPTLQKLIEEKHEVAAVVTQPDKPKGRGKAVQFTPVKEIAVKYDIPVYQPQRIKQNKEFYEQMKQINPDVMVVVAFGQILPKEILDLPKYGCVNVHASLLPRYRGAAPIQWVILDGEKETGVTTMMMDVGLDTGDMLLKEMIPLDEKETGGSLHDKLSTIGGDLLIETLKQLEAGTITRTPQGDAESNYAKMLTKELGHIDFTKSAEELERLIRGLNPWPSAYTSLQGKTLKIWDANVVEGSQDAKPGEVFAVGKNSFTVMTGDKALEIMEMQLEGKKRMTTEAFLRGYTVEKGEVLA